ncbi:hypothetical protein STAQ_13310 [Allostella sp. ATCC 35155]|nr:hypothetical protein STAQ_13310 [Stella sp. ATCC 35155]
MAAMGDPPDILHHVFLIHPLNRPLKLVRRAGGRYAMLGVATRKPGPGNPVPRDAVAGPQTLR